MLKKGLKTALTGIWAENINIPEIIRDKSKLSENDFYFAVGDGNYLYGQVHTSN